jgi:L-threonylcarbamoyladenylate synthase
MEERNAPGPLALIACGTTDPGLPPDAFVYRVTLPAESGAYARQLYAALREADHSGASALLIELPPDHGEWTAVRDRLLRATRPLLRS